MSFVKRKMQQGGDVPTLGPQPLPVRDHLSAATRGLYPQERRQLRNLEEEYGYVPSTPIQTGLPPQGQENLAGWIDRDKNFLMLNAAQTGDRGYGALPQHQGRMTGELLSHELGHVLHRNDNINQDVINQIIDEEADRLGVNDQRRKEMKSMSGFFDALEAKQAGENVQSYEERPQEQFAHMVEQTIRSDNPDEFNQAIVERLMQKDKRGLADM